MTTDSKRNAKEIQPQEIFSAIKDGNLEMVRKLLEKGADPNLQNINGTGTLLHYAVAFTKADIVQELITKGALVNTEDNLKESPLHVATALLHEVDDEKEVTDLELIVKYLLKAGANPNTKSFYRTLYEPLIGNTPLHSAANYNNTSMVRELIKYGAMINETTNEQNTPLHIAAMFGGVSAAKVLLQNGANPNLMNTNGETPLHLAAFRGYVRLTKLLLKHGADPNMETDTHEQTAYQLSPLHYAVMEDEEHGLLGTVRGRVNVVKELVKNGAKIDGNGSRMPPIHMAMFAREYPEFGFILLKLGANPNLLDRTDESPLIRAVYYSNVKMVKTLLKYGANINAISGDERWTPLHHAFHGWYGDYTSRKKIVSMLSKFGADAYAKDCDGITPIHEALTSNLSKIESIILIMLEKGKNTKIDRKTGSTILDIAMKKGFVKIARIVLRDISPEPKITDSIYPLKLFL